MVDEQNFVDVIARRLDTIAYILMNLKRFEGMTAEDRILALKGLGHSDTEVARMIGKTRSYVSSVASKARKASP